jgi:uncharacterized protein YjbJ (UPF0337 family)
MRQAGSASSLRNAQRAMAITQAGGGAELRGGVTMSIDKDRVEGSAKNMSGKAKEAFGKATGDQKTKADGKADQVKGKAQNAFGSAKDKAKGK